MRIFFTLLAFATLSACSLPREDLKSPCAGAAGSPCERRPVNTQLL